MNAATGAWIACRLCEEKAHLPSVPGAAAWYLLHTIDKHWEMIEQLRDASPEVRAAALIHASARGWL